MTDLKSVNIFLDRSEVIHDTEQLLDLSRKPLSAEAALTAHVCMTRGLVLGSKLDVGATTATSFFWGASLELKDHILSRRDTVTKFIVSSIIFVPGGKRKRTREICSHVNRLFWHWYASHSGTTSVSHLGKLIIIHT